MIELKLTKEEATVLYKLIDVAVRNTGLDAAQAGYILGSKIQEALKTPEEEKKEDKKEKDAK